MWARVHKLTTLFEDGCGMKQYLHTQQQQKQQQGRTECQAAVANMGTAAST
jgi:hypothetical protein